MSDAMITRRGGGGGSSRLQSKTVTPAAIASTVTPDSGYDGLSSVMVAAITPQKEATSYTPGTADQTIAANQWLAGAQTILGDANLLAANIKKGVSIFNVAGSYEATVLDTNSAILKVVTSTGCSVSVTNGTDTFTQQDADGFVRPNDANVTEHFFVIPTAAFGTFDVTSTHPTYGDNTKTNAVVIGNAGKVYEVLCGGINIILDSTFGLQDGFTIAAPSIWEYSERYKRIERVNRGNIVRLFNQAVNVTPYEHFTVNSEAAYNSSGYVALKDADDVTLGSCGFNGSGYHDETATIKDKYYPTAEIYTAYDLYNITKIVLS